MTTSTAKFSGFRVHHNRNRHQAGPETLSLDDLSAGDVVIKALYSGINYKDALAATGAGEILRKSPLVAGIDVAGLVENSSVSEFAPGDQVMICGCGLSETRDGGYAEFVRSPADCIDPLPPGLSLYEVMAIGSAGFTAALALEAMQHNGQDPEQGTVAVTGATGGVGSYAVSLLADSGYRTVAITGKPQCREYLESLGAAEVLLRDRLDLGKRPLEKGCWGGAIDTLGGEILAWLTRTIEPRGNLAAVGLAAGIQLETTVMPFILRGINLLGINSVYCDRPTRRKVWHRLASDLRPKSIGQIVKNEITLDQLTDHFSDYIAGNMIGRTVVKIATP